MTVIMHPWANWQLDCVRGGTSVTVSTILKITYLQEMMKASSCSGSRNPDTVCNLPIRTCLLRSILRPKVLLIIRVPHYLFLSSHAHRDLDLYLIITFYIKRTRNGPSVYTWSVPPKCLDPALGKISHVSKNKWFTVCEWKGSRLCTLSYFI